MIRKNIFGGCSPRSNVSQCDNKYIYFCSYSNILIADSIEIKDVVFLDNQLNFLHVENGIIIAGDIKGRIYLIKNNEIIKIDVNENVQNGIIISNNRLIYMTLNSVILFDYSDKVVLATYNNKDIVSSCCFSNDIVYVGTSEGNILIFNTELELVCELNGHADRIQSMSTTCINGDFLVATASKDNTIKIWKENNKRLEHVQTLNGHSDWVSSVSWCENNDLLSSSFDKTIILWTKTVESEHVWTNTNIYGGHKSFYNAFRYLDVIYGQSSSGGFYKFNDKLSDFISGHTNEITSLDWQDFFLLTSSLDKTSRMFFYNREIFRTQNHGYPITRTRFIDKNSLSIISGSQETIMRVLEPTYITYMAINSNQAILSRLEVENELYKKNNFKNLKLKETEDVKIAAVPAELSLTNDVVDDFDFEGLNEYLLSSTMFNEIKKIYGHYFDISDIDVSDQHIVSVNKALTKKFSGIFLWNKSYEIIEYLEIHNSTINRVRFSPDGKYICTTSSDKSTSLIEVVDGLKVKYTNTDHTRTVWDCSFSADSKYYATCSRDKTIYIYEIETNKIQLSQLMEEEVTTIDFNPTKYELLIGLLSGVVKKIVFDKGKFILQGGFSIKTNSKRINMLRYNKDGRYVAICGSDWLVSVYETKE